MRIISAILYIGSCIIGLAGAFFPFYTLIAGNQVTNVAIYADVWGKAFLVAAAIGLICTLIGIHQISFGASIVALGTFIAKYVTIVVAADNNSYVNGQLNTTFNSYNGLIDNMEKFGSFSVSMGYSYYCMMISVIGMVNFGLLFFMAGKSRTPFE